MGAGSAELEARRAPPRVHGIPGRRERVQGPSDGPRVAGASSPNGGAQVNRTGSGPLPDAGLSANVPDGRSWGGDQGTDHRQGRRAAGAAHRFRLRAPQRLGCRVGPGARTGRLPRDRHHECRHRLGLRSPGRRRVRPRPDARAHRCHRRRGRRPGERRPRGRLRRHPRRGRAAPSPAPSRSVPWAPTSRMPGAGACTASTTQSSGWPPRGPRHRAAPSCSTPAPTPTSSVSRATPSLRRSNERTATSTRAPTASSCRASPRRTPSAGSPTPSQARSTWWLGWRTRSTRPRCSRSG